MTLAADASAAARHGRAHGSHAHQENPPVRPLAPDRPPLRRPRDCAVTGVSAALAAHLRWPVAAVRALFVLLTPLAGFGVLLYLWLWALVPWQDAGAAGAVGSDAPTRRAPVAWLLLSFGAAAALATLVLLAATSPATPVWLPTAFVAGVLVTCAGVWAAVIDRVDAARGPRHAFTIRTGATIVLAVLAVAFVASLARSSFVLVGFLCAVGSLAAIAVVYSATLVDTWRALGLERVRRIREEQRSEMAAHLHDSVLQTLALIQHRAGASSEVARLARAQERELRGWLYDGDAPADSDLPTDLRDYAAALELDYATHIEVVSAGLSAERASGEVAAAAREAMLNAARHAGGEVSVYIEGTASAVDVFVRDRGPGFDLDAVAGDRLGVRQSIIGRMRRAGGSATVRRAPGGVGTEVHLRYDRGDGPRG